MLKKFEANTVGSDYVVGDIHGDWDAVDQALLDVRFDDDVDRLFSVGDLIDRGPESERALEWLSKPWFHAVRGNHEDMCIEVFKGTWPVGNYIQNGGAWVVGLSRAEQQTYVDAFDSLPYAMEIDTPTGKVGVVHAEVPDHDWSLLGEPPYKETMLWARTKFNRQDATEVANIDRVYVGHTPLKHVVQLGNVYYIDTGSVFPEGSLTIVKIN